MSKCLKMGRGHKIPSGTEPMRMIGTPMMNCEIWYIKIFDFAVYTKDGLIVLRHREPERLIGALLGPNVKRIELMRHKRGEAVLANQHFDRWLLGLDVEG